MKKIWILLPSLLLGGCLFQSNYHEPAEFDLKPVSVRFNSPVVFGTFTNLSGADRRLMSRNDFRIERDEYARWIGSPDVMLMRALSAALPESDGEKESAVCSLTLYSFGWDGDRAVLTAEISMRCKDETRRRFFRAEEKCEGDKTEQRLAALDKCVNVLAETIAAETDKISGAKK